MLCSGQRLRRPRCDPVQPLTSASWRSGMRTRGESTPRRPDGDVTPRARRRPCWLCCSPVGHSGSRTRFARVPSHRSRWCPRRHRRRVRRRRRAAAASYGPPLSRRRGSVRPPPRAPPVGPPDAWWYSARLPAAARRRCRRRSRARPRLSRARRPRGCRSRPRRGHRIPAPRLPVPPLPAPRRPLPGTQRHCHHRRRRRQRHRRPGFPSRSRTPVPTTTTWTNTMDTTGTAGRTTARTTATIIAERTATGGRQPPALPQHRGLVPQLCPELWEEPAVEVGIAGDESSLGRLSSLDRGGAHHVRVGWM